MVKQTIQIFARVKPTKASKAGLYEVDEDSEGFPQLTFTVPRDIADGLVNNKKEAYKFRFEKVFDQKTKQDEIFENVAQPVINNVLQGYNGTIFAYGQTGSGKTFTITGGAERYVDRGIIPRTLSYIFEYYAKNPEYVYTTHVSYLEIYNENGYDLLDPRHEAAKLEDLPKVSLMEDSDQNIHLKNLSTHPANNEEEALNLLFLGDTNRMIAETPMNQASTRSHCIFTIHVSSRESGSATIRRSKLHLVDLAGSERVSKTGVNGVLLTEAKYINLSLHYLEQVIVSLSEKNRQHIPYRNSMMTSVLRDSLGGNCMTTMIATCSIEKKNLDESISTCRFAQRVALIKNEAILNEELDPKLVIARLKNQVNQLKEELAMATGEQRTDELTEEELERCKEAVKYYLQDNDPEATIGIGGDMRKINYCFKLLKQEVQRRVAAPDTQGEPPATDRSTRTPTADVYPAKDTEAGKLRELIKQRDNEINILVNMLKKEKKRAADAVNQLERAGRLPDRSASQNDATNGRQAHSHTLTRLGTTADTRKVSSADLVENPHHQPSNGVLRNKKPKPLDPMEEKTKKQILGDLSMGRQEAFEIYRRDYEHSQTISDNKTTLKQRYAEAKTLGERVNQARTKINKLKASIEQHRMSRVMQGLVDPDNPEPDDMEQDMKVQMEEEKAKYKEAFNRLRVLKTEIEHLQHFLERSKVKLMKDFELWWAEQAAAAQEQQSQQPPVGSKKAWNTPPVTPPIQTSSTSNVQKRPSVASRLMNQSPAAPSGGQNGDDRFSPQKSRATFIKESPSAPNLASSIPLTGDAQADADIMAFLRARQNVMRAAAQQQSKR